MINARWIKIICCPICKGKLLYKVYLYCNRCRRKYLVIDDIPILVADTDKNNAWQYEHQRKYFDKLFLILLAEFPYKLNIHFNLSTTSITHPIKWFITIIFSLKCFSSLSFGHTLSKKKVL